MDKTKNYYRVLGVLPSAEPIVIRAAYRALAAKYHPDKWPGDKASAERRMKEINEAYEILSNDKSRKEYDSVRQKQEFEDYEFENDATQEAFQDAEKAQRSDWDVAIEYYPELNAISADLRKTSTKLAFAFRATVLETKQFSQGKRLAEQLEQSFLRTYFGRNPEIIRFARTLIASGHKAAARELNRAISVLGHGADEEVIIARIQKRFDLAPKDTTSEHTADTASERATDIIPPP